jgi:hypothetical protein
LGASRARCHFSRRPTSSGTRRRGDGVRCRCPTLGQEQPPLKPDGGCIGDRVHGDRDLEVGLLAQGPAALVRDSD